MSADIRENSVLNLWKKVVLCHLKRYFIISAFVILSVSSLAQEAFISGIMTADRTWYSDTTYIVFQDFVVPSGVVLTINPGVTVKIRYGIEFIVDAGTLRVNGTEEDSVNFLPYHTNPGHMWKWSGLSVLNSGVENEVNITYAIIKDAETAIRLENSNNVLIESTSLLDCQNLGIYMMNSSYCYIVNSRIESNYNGIELYADFLGSTSNNLIWNCVISNENHNIYVFREEGGIYQNNIISENIISGGNNGIWINNNGGSVNSENIIERNIIANNGTNVGYGLLLAHDSTIVSNNIFWRNNIAIFSEDKGNNSSIYSNSFYQNNWAIAIGGGSENNSYENNTFSENTQELLGVKETVNNNFEWNNLLNNDGMHNIVVNHTTEDMLVTNNYWGTTDTSQINDLIYDFRDNPGFGELVYEPFMENADTNNPISPPFMVKKQLVNNKLLITWHANSEADLVRYNMYYGEFKDYSFMNVIELELDTVYLSNVEISIDDNVAVTALDTDFVNPDSKVDGHESPFAFAEIYPYAGNDTILCENQPEIFINNSNIPYFYNEIEWRTGGDGAFNNPNLLNPTYYPGILDVANGNVELQINVTSDNDEKMDSFILTIVDNPVAFAGNDTVIFRESDVILEGAYAENYNYVFWESSGDGYFDNVNLVNPIYYPGTGDDEVGAVYLKMTSVSDCGQISDSVRIFIEPYFSIEGKMWTDDRLPYGNGVVLAFIEEMSETRAAFIESTIADGSFRFDKVMSGNYYLYALPDTNNVDGLVPGYYANKLRWQNAYLLPVHEDVYDIDISLPSVDADLPPGVGSISGHMVLPDNSNRISNIYCMPWFDVSINIFCNGGLSNSTVLLFNSDKSSLLDYTITNSNGDFYFYDLPYGNYIVDAEKAGYSTSSSSVIKLTPDNKDETGVVLEIENRKIGITIYSDENLSENFVFPNPASKQININTENLEIEINELYIYNSMGVQMINKQMDLSLLHTTITIEIDNFLPGIYFGRLSNFDSSKHISFQFIVQGK